MRGERTMTYEELRQKCNGKNIRRHPKFLEDQLQKSCVQWFDIQYPQYRALLHHSPNGGKRNAIEAAKLKQMGVRAGFPDLILLVPNKEYYYMGIELKTQKGRQSEYQKEFQNEFGRIGAKYVVIRSIGEFMRIINEYLNDI